MSLTDTYPLTPTQVQAYRHDGFIRLRDVLTADVLADYRQVITDVVRSLDHERLIAQAQVDYGPRFADRYRQGLAAAQGSPQSTYARAFTQRMNLWRHSAAVERLVRSPRLAGIATALMGTRGVRLYHDQALYKEAGGGHTPWHVDQFYWPLSNNNTVTVWMPLQAVPLAMGPVAFARGSQQGAADGVAAQLAISDESEAQLAQLMAGFEQVEAPFELGEVSFHSGWTCHRAGPNQTDQTRAAFTVIYMDSQMRMIEPRHRNHVADARMWLPGVAAGELAASHLNPLLFGD